MNLRNRSGQVGTTVVRPVGKPLSGFAPAEAPVLVGDGSVPEGNGNRWVFFFTVLVFGLRGEGRGGGRTTWGVNWSGNRPKSISSSLTEWG